VPYLSLQIPVLILDPLVFWVRGGYGSEMRECRLQIAGFHQSERQIIVRIHERRIQLKSGPESRMASWRRPVFRSAAPSMFRPAPVDLKCGPELPRSALRVQLGKQKCPEIRVRCRVARFKRKPVPQNCLLDGATVISSASREHLEP